MKLLHKTLKVVCNFRLQNLILKLTSLTDLSLQLQISNLNPEVALISQLQISNPEVGLIKTLFLPLLHKET
jgi:hypothetical protein